MAALINREKLVADVYQGTTDPLYSLIPAGITATPPRSSTRTPSRTRSGPAVSSTRRASACRCASRTATPRAGVRSAAEAAELKEQLERAGFST
ncbi:hypothetical protein [Streptomyces stelliscabiei]|uniref:hypothetical protein n=1 Tax=Streptomyces stelliscabiei TaxID=146820 RepID=UPI003A8FA338